MAQAMLVLSIFDKCLNIFGLVRDGKLRRGKQVDDGLNALFNALCETKAYVSRLNYGEKRDRRHESDIAHLWHDASVPLRHIDPELARRCFYKGSFWHDPDSWTAVQLKESKIALDQVCKSAEELLTKGSVQNVRKEKGENKEEDRVHYRKLTQRRKFLTGLTLTAGIVTSGVSGWIFALWDKLDKEETNTNVPIDKIFPFWKDVQLVPGQSHPGIGYHPDVEEAQRKIVSLMPRGGKVELFDINNLPEAELYRDLLLVGGPISNSLSSYIHGYSFTGRKISVTPEIDIGTRWQFYYPYPTENDRAFYRYVDGKLKKNWAKALVDKHGKGATAKPRYVKIDPETDRILSDFLLVTVIPNTLQSQASGATIVDIGDLYGQGDKTFSQILEEEGLRKQLNSALKQKKYFQALYEVRVTHDDEKQITLPETPVLKDIYILG